MISIKRGRAPVELEQINQSELARLQALHQSGQPIGKKQIGEKYKKVGINLHKLQFGKCCYCEKELEKEFNDVEHWRPQGSAERGPGSTQKHGYWWLAFTWSNLLFACDFCNRSAKNDQFPLQDSATLQPNQRPPGKEKPLLLDPARSNMNPIAHLEYCLINQIWTLVPRGGSPLGYWTIKILKLNRTGLQDKYNKHVNVYIKPFADSLLAALREGAQVSSREKFESACALFAPHATYAALTYDALRHFVPDQELLKVIGKTWPAPDQACL